jgi:DNA polymerase (family 10)
MPERELDNKGASAVLQEVALLLELKGENPFKVKAYFNAARSIKTIAHHIIELVTTGC